MKKLRFCLPLRLPLRLPLEISACFLGGLWGKNMGKKAL